MNIENEKTKEYESIIEFVEKNKKYIENNVLKPEWNKIICEQLIIQYESKLNWLFKTIKEIYKRLILYKYIPEINEDITGLILLVSQFAYEVRAAGYNYELNGKFTINDQKTLYNKLIDIIKSDYNIFVKEEDMPDIFLLVNLIDLETGTRNYKLTDYIINNNWKR